jgi:uncharacterized membrane protein (Fun14 family)
MTTETLYSIAGTLGGSFFGSFLIGFFIKKIIKILMFVFGGVLALLMYLQSQGMISVEVNLDKIQSSIEALISSIAANTTNLFPNDSNSSIVDSNLGIPFTVSIASRIYAGRYKKRLNR